MKDHFMTSDTDGARYDTRGVDWSRKQPLRANFSRTFQKIETLAELKATMRNGQYAWPGGYQMYLIMGDGEPAAFDAVRKEWREIVGAFFRDDKRDQWRVVGCEIYWEGAPIECSISGTMIESAYGDPEAAEEA